MNTIAIIGGGASGMMAAIFAARKGAKVLLLEQNDRLGKKILERLGNGIIKENPILVGMLGICSTLAVTTSAINGLGMGASTLIVLALSNLIISSQKFYTEQCSYSGIYSYCSFTRYHNSVLYAGIRS